MHHKFDSGELKRKEIRLIRPSDLYDLRIDLDQALSRLTPRERQAVTLYADGFTQLEIAERIGTHQSTISRILKKLHKKSEIVRLVPYRG